MEKTLVKPICVIEGLAGKKPLSMKNWRIMTEATEGRDKFSKIIQYGSRFWAWYFLSMNGKSDIGQRMFALYKLTQMSRKAFRIVKVINEIDKLNDTLRKKNVPVWLMVFLIMKHLGIGTFWVYDNFIYFSEAKLSPVARDKALKISAKAWFVSSISGIVAFAVAMNQNHKKCLALAERLQCENDDEQKLQLETDLKALSKEQFKNFLMLVKFCCDAGCSGNMPGLEIPKSYLGSKWNDGVIGILGVISGAVTCYCNWPDKETLK